MTKSQINKLGKSIRRKLRDSKQLESELLDDLQNYRTSYKDDVSQVFDIISKISKNARKDTITSFRIKRIESILSKIKRQPTMALANMGDIAGCRIIVYDEAKIKEIVSELRLIFNVRDHNDYITTPKADGYRGFHIYIESPINSDKLIEIQIRTVKSHKWASMVEIIDILYDLKIKEGQKNPDFEEFLLLLSDKENLNIEQKKNLLRLDDKLKIYNKLNKTFVKNQLQVRSDWINIEDDQNNYFIFEVDKNKNSKIFSFCDYETAEQKYFEKFKENNHSNFVLAQIEKPSFKRICISYASYVLTQHDYLDDWLLFTEEIIRETTKNLNSEELEYFFLYTDKNLSSQNEVIANELKQLKAYYQNDKLNKIRLDEWREDCQEKLNKIKQYLQKLRAIFDEYKDEIKKNKKSLFTKIFGS